MKTMTALLNALCYLSHCYCCSCYTLTLVPRLVLLCAAAVHRPATTVHTDSPIGLAPNPVALQAFASSASLQQLLCFFSLRSHQRITLPLGL